jgi:putative peptidoglycan lipid II flippase
MAGNVALMWRYGVGGLALATALASTANAAALLWLLRRRVGLLGGRRIGVTLLKALAGTAVLAGAAAVPAYAFSGSLLWRVPAAVAAGAAAYLVAARFLGMEERRALRRSSTK